MSIDQCIGQENFKDTHGAILRKHVGDARRNDNGLRFSIAELAEQTPFISRTVKSWRTAATCPNLADWIILARLLGPHYVNDCLRHAGFGNAAPLQFSASVQITGNHAQYELAQRMASLSEAMLDGHIDRIERSQLIPEFQQLVSNLNLFIWGLQQTGKSAPGGDSHSITKE